MANLTLTNFHKINQLSESDPSLMEYPVKVLLIDDQVIVAEAVRRLLAIEEDIKFHYCEDPAAAIPIANKIQPTVILLDLVMPEIDGLMLLRFLRANPATRSIPTIVLSSKEDPQLKAQAFAQGANDYLVKLPDKIELIARIRYHSDAYKNFLKRYEADLVKRYNQELEKQVEERTAELKQTLENLQQTQAQLVQTEKMSSLGQMVAGVAHEINNPVNFISGNLDPAIDYMQDLLELVGLYQKYYPNPASEIQEFSEEIELDFMREDVLQLLSSMKIGTDRIRDIVLQLRNFSRLDEADMKPVNIHEGIDNTLLILQHRLKGIELSKEYGDLPLVSCYAGQLNQVFMNIIANAIDVLESDDSNSQPGQIKIRTEVVKPNYVTIRISDNGPGIPLEVRQRIFDPFFTTKPVGKGTGLGLSISYQIIVDKHKGFLGCSSSPETGTEFIIEIPVQQKKASLLRKKTS
ncbi:MAG: ATP-binding protein [Hormoscilla sp.]